MVWKLYFTTVLNKVSQFSISFLTEPLSSYLLLPQLTYQLFGGAGQHIAHSSLTLTEMCPCPITIPLSHLLCSHLLNAHWPSLTQRMGEGHLLGAIF